jgi:hypothetical protein
MFKSLRQLQDERKKHIKDSLDLLLIFVSGLAAMGIAMLVIGLVGR